MNLILLLTVMTLMLLRTVMSVNTITTLLLTSVCVVSGIVFVLVAVNP